MSDQTAMSPALNVMLKGGHDLERYLPLELQTPHFRVGDIVTRDGADLQRVISTNGDDQQGPDMIEVECIREPATDKLSPIPWCRLGEREDNLARRYSYPAA